MTYKIVHYSDQCVISDVGFNFDIAFCLIKPAFQRHYILQ